MKTIEDFCCIIDAISGKAVCPLLNVEIRAVVQNTIAEVTVTQNYINLSNGNIEGLYMFPLPHKAQVTGFTCKAGVNEVRGEFREKEEAFAEYDKAVRRGDSAFLLESHRPDIFQVSLGNIAKGEKASVTISYSEEIKIIDHELRWVLPTVIAPRYIPGKRTGRVTGPGTAAPTDKVPDADYITPPTGNTSYTLKINAVFSGFSGWKKVTSPSHPIEVRFDENVVTVTLSKENELLDSDFVVSAYVDEDNTDSFVTALANTDVAIGSARFTVDLDDCEVKVSSKEYIFLIDVSGSMGGEKLEQAKRALSISLRNLMEGDYFNIIAFESNYSCYSKEVVPYTQQNLEKADKWIAHLREMGGTEIYEPLRYALEKQVKAIDLERVVLLFTDGQVGNEKEIIALVHKYNHSLQLFPFGIDTAVNTYFIDCLAAAGNGMPEYIYPGERIEDKVIRQFSRMDQPFLYNPAVVGKDGRELTAAPALPARIYNSETYGFLVRSDDEESLEEIRIAGLVGGVKRELKLKAGSTGNARLLGISWAKARIKQLEEQFLQSGYERRNQLIQKEITACSIKYGVLSTRTSLVAVYKRPVKETGIPETIVVPVSKPQGWIIPDEPDAMVCYAAAPCVTEISMRSYSPADRDGIQEQEEMLDMPMFLRRKKTSSCRSASSGKERGVQSQRKVRSEQDENMSFRRDDPLTEISRSSTLEEIIRNVAQAQNADGSFGTGKETNNRTAYYIIGMLTTDKSWKPYRIQIMKAGERFMKTLAADTENMLLKTLAAGLLKKEGLLKDSRLVSFANEMAGKLSESERHAYEGALSGELGLLYKQTGFKAFISDDGSTINHSQAVFSDQDDPIATKWQVINAFSRRLLEKAING